MPIDISALPLIGGHSALDLVNTMTPRVPIGADAPYDHLLDPPALLRWASRVALVSEDEATAVVEAWHRDPGAAHAALNAAREVREALHGVLLAVAGLAPDGVTSSGTALELLHCRWLAAVGRSAFVLDDAGAPAVRLAVGSAPALLLPDRVVSAALDLLTTADLARLGRCPPESGGCGWMFLDLSRNGSRRWCRMSDCGTDVKSRRLTERRRAAR
jgi:predicted RNA-binding Zn ribbon-like protein